MYLISNSWKYSAHLGIYFHKLWELNFFLGFCGLFSTNSSIWPNLAYILMVYYAVPNTYESLNNYYFTNFTKKSFGHLHHQLIFPFLPFSPTTLTTRYLKASRRELCKSPCIQTDLSAFSIPIVIISAQDDTPLRIYNNVTLIQKIISEI